MKLIKIKTTSGVENVSIANVSSWVATGGAYDSIIHVYKTTAGKYGFLVVCPLITEQTQLENAYIGYLKENGSEQVVNYVGNKFKQDAFEEGRIVILDSLNELYSTDNHEYSYSYVLTTRIGLSQLPDTFASTAGDPEEGPGVVTIENSTYTFSSNARSLFATAVGSTYSKIGGAPGVSMSAFYDYSTASAVYDTVDAAINAGEQAGIAMASKQCAEFKDKYFDAEAAADEGKKLEDEAKAAEESQVEAVSNLDEAQATLSDAQEALSEAQQELEKTKEDNAAEKTKCLNNYNECLQDPGIGPAECLATYNTCLAEADAQYNIPEAEANVAAREEGLAEAQQQANIAQQELNAADQALTEAQEAEQAHKNAMAQIESLCNDENVELRNFAIRKPEKE